MADIFEGVRIVDMTQNAMCQCASAFSDFGAEIIHIERPTGGGERTYYPMIDGKPGGYLWFGRGRKSLTLNTKHPEAIKIIKDLVKTADIFVESSIPGAMDRNGLGYDDLIKINPKLVYISISAFGSQGPMAHKPGYDTLGQAMSGRWAVTGEKGGVPLKDGNTIADFTGAFCAYSAGVTALYHAQRTGEGQHVEVSLVGSMFYFNSTFDRLNDGVNIKPNGNHHSGCCPFGGFENGKGDMVVICAPQPKPWANLCRAMGREDLIDDEKFDTNNKRCQHQDEVVDLIETWLATFPTIEDAIKVLDENDVPYGQVLDNEQILHNEQMIANHLWEDAPTPNGYSEQTYRARSPFAKFSKTPGHIHKTALLGENNHEIMSELGYSDEDIERLQEEFAK